MFSFGCVSILPMQSFTEHWSTKEVCFKCSNNGCKDLGQCANALKYPLVLVQLSGSCLLCDLHRISQMKQILKAITPVVWAKWYEMRLTQECGGSSIAHTLGVISWGAWRANIAIRGNFSSNNRILGCRCLIRFQLTSEISWNSLKCTQLHWFLYTFF